MENLPESPRKHFNLRTKDPVQDAIRDYCVRALLIPDHHIVQWEPLMNYDSYYVYTANGCRFVVSSQEVTEWEVAKKRVCSPDRNLFNYDETM